MAYLASMRRMGNGVPTLPYEYVPSNLASLASSLGIDTSGTSPNFLGTLANATTDAENFLYNVASGNLDANQVAQISDAGNASIARASGANAALAAAEQAQWNADLAAVVNQSSNTSWTNILADLGLGGGPGGTSSAPSGILGWVESNFVLLFAGVAAFLIFRPDKAFK